MEKKQAMIPLSLAVLCENCLTISELRGEKCPVCKAEGCLLSLQRVLNPSAELGSVTFVLKGDKTYWSNWP